MVWNADRRRLILVAIGLTLLGLAIIGLWLLRRVLEPRPVGAWVAIEVGGSGIAEVGRVEVPAGTACTLHAVLEARNPDGTPVYYTAAGTLHFDGRPVAPAELARWPEGTEVQVLWFTVEGLKPYLEADAGFVSGELGFRSSFRADWPRTWTVPAILDSSSSSFAQGRELLHGGDFGTQRYHVRIEFYDSSEALMPERRFSSWEGDALPEEEAQFPTLVATLPQPLARLSRLFGLSQVEPAANAPDDLAARLEAWQLRDLAFSRVAAIQSLLSQAGVAATELDWSPVDLSAGPGWGAEGAAEGDLARVGDRLVVLVADRGIAGRLDRDDLCFDFDRGIAVRRLGEVFSAAEGLVEWASLDGPSDRD